MNRLNNIENLALKLNEIILNEPVVQEYKKYEYLIINNKKLKADEEMLKKLQKKIVNQKAAQDEHVVETIALYKKKKNEFENHPLVVNYLYLKQEVDDLLQTINSMINNQLK